MFSRAVVATDLGPSSDGIVGCAGTLGSLGVREAFLVYALDLSDGPSAEQDAAFARQAESLERDGIVVHVETPLGYAPHAITSLAIEREAGLIVMGTHGMGLFHTGFSGSVSSDVIRLSTVPLLLGPATLGTDQASGVAVCSRLLSSVLVPIDLQSSSETLCDMICALGGLDQMRLELMHVVPIDSASVREDREGQARAMLDGFARRARAAGVNEISVTVARGAPEELVGSYAGSGRYSMVALAPRCHDTIDQAFGSVTSAVIRRSTVPILLSPPGCDLELHALGKT